MNNIIANFISDYFAEAPNILHFGSSIKNNHFDDIDLLIISTKHSFFTKQSFSYKEKKIDLIILPSTKVLQILELNKATGVYNNIITNGKILVDQNGLLANLKLRTKKKTNIHLLKKISYEKEIKNTLQTISSSNCLYEKDILLNDLTKVLIDYKLLKFDNFKYFKDTKHKLREINKVQPDYIKSISNFKKKYLLTNDFDRYIEDLDGLIPVSNILKKKKYSNHLISIYTSGDLVILIKKISEESLNHFHHFLKSNNVDYYSFRANHSFFYLEEGIYIVIKQKKSTKEIKELIEKIDFIFLKLYKKDKILSVKYPYQLDLSSFLGIYDKQFKLIEKIFLKTSILLNSKKYSETYLLFTYIYFILSSYIFNLKKSDLKKDLIFYGDFLGQGFLKNTSHKKLYNKLYDYNFSDFYPLKENIQKLFKESIETWSPNYLPESNIKHLIFKTPFTEIKNRTILFIFASNFFSISDEYLVFIFHIIGEMVENSYEN